MKTALSLAAAAVLGLSLAACEGERDEPIEENLEQAGDDIKDAGEDIGDDIEDAGDDVEDAVDPD